MSFVFHLRRVKSLPKSIPSLGIWLTLFVLFLIGKGQQSNAQETTRIFSGTAARKGRYPYMCSLRKEAFGLHICGGALINKDWMITAAHCVDPNDAKSAGLRPYAYCDIFESRDRDPSKRFKTSCRLHHMWNGNFGNDGDIALCKLDKSTGLPIPQLASIGETIVDGSIFSVLGWGKTSSRNEVADTLQIGENLKYVSNSACNAGRKLSITIIDSMVCAGDGSVDTCLGDSGGPLLEPNKRNNPLAENPELDLIVGITSFGSEACRGAPGVYARISCYRQWIDCVIQGKGQDCNVHIPCEEKSDPCSGVSRNSTFDEANALIRIERALQSDDSELVKEILCQGLNSNAVFKGFNHSLLIRAAQHDAVKSAQVLLQQGTNLEYKNSFGQTALSRAARYGSARLFIDKRANIESKTNIGWTALYYAARYNHLQIAQILIENGAKLESKSNIGWTPLHTASEHNSLAVAKVLIIAGANINSKQDSGWTPLHLAAEEGSLEVAKELIAAGADLSSRTNNGSTPLHLTAQFNSVEELIASGADLSSRTNKGHTPLHTAAQFNSIEIAKELIAAGSDISSRTNKGFTPLHLAAQFNSVQIVRELLSKNAELEARTNFGDTPLQIASYHGSFDVLQMLLDKEAIVESVNNKKQTPLHYASSRGHASVVRVLLLNGASKTSTDDDGKTPLDVICTNKFLDRPCTNNIINAIRSLLET